MALCSDIKSFLTSVESGMYIGNMPSSDSASVVVPTGGYAPERTLNNDTITMPTVMIHVRDLSFATGYNRCVAIQNILDNVTHTTVNGTFYISIRRVGDINYLGIDDRARHLFSMNYIIKK